MKYYGGKERFLDIRSLVAGEEVPVDLLGVNGFVAINMVHFGLDSKVAAIMERVRHMPVIGGHNAYLVGVMGAVVQPLRFRCKIWADGELLNNTGELLLCTLAGGRYVGGSYMAAPRSDNQDGLMEVCVVQPMSRLRFLRMMNAYKAGTHLDDPRIKGRLCYRQAKAVRLEVEPPFTISMDGELMDIGNVEVKMLPGAIRFVVPK